jgi:hypothetical protein
MRTLFQDVRFAPCILGKSPGFTLTVLAVLALGIGATSAMFSVSAGLLRPLPYPDPDRGEIPIRLAALPLDRVLRRAGRASSSRLT